ncbi:hypothetical protein [Absidia glauca]|uniref:PH domain-containing protein n=1 Tax=Absidia glauca TaxID=4829 RepID=A0A168P5F3_ABSGL|nr:hypothetical protein [Absidia glauca]
MFLYSFIPFVSDYKIPRGSLLREDVAHFISLSFASSLMMITLGIYFVVYLLGGLTFLPSIFITFWYLYSKRQDVHEKATGYPPEAYTGIDEHRGKKGWIRLVCHSASMSPVAVKKSFSFTKTVLMAGSSSTTNAQGGVALGEDGSDFEINSDLHSSKRSGAPFVFSSSSSTLFYAILRHGTLFCFDSEQEKVCHLIIPMHDYSVSLFPKEGKKESELFNRTMSICLAPKNISANNNDTSSRHYYLSCKRPTDKEDWYLALKAATYLLSEDDPKNAHHMDWQDSTLYDAPAMAKLQGQLNGTPAQLQAQCWNALMGRLFLGIYKTEHWRQLWHNKMKNKLDKINAYQRLQLQQQHQQHQRSGNTTSKRRSMMKLSPFQLELISMGETIPCLTETKLVEFSANGNCVIHGQLEYTGDFLVVIRTDFRYLWPTLASTFERKKKATTIPTPSSSNGAASTTSTTTTNAESLPGSLPLILSIKLRRCSGKVVFKIKPPPSGRVWAAFETMPKMEWEVTPIVMDKQIKWSLVIKLIQAKIKEMVMESLVMPNMEDFPFFDSDGLGGIFGERAPMKDPAADTESTASTTTTTTMNDDTTADDTRNDDNDEKQQQQQLPTVSKLVQGYINRIKTPHKMAAATLHPQSSNATKA